jgi:hypothetical protein
VGEGDEEAVAEQLDDAAVVLFEAAGQCRGELRHEAAGRLVAEPLEDAGAPDKVSKYDGGHAPRLYARALPEQRSRRNVCCAGFAGGSISLVGVAGFELATPCTPCKCATRLRYTPSPPL